MFLSASLPDDYPHESIPGGNARHHSFGRLLAIQGQASDGSHPSAGPLAGSMSRRSCWKISGLSLGPTSIRDNATICVIFSVRQQAAYTVWSVAADHRKLYRHKDTTTLFLSPLVRVGQLPDGWLGHRLLLKGIKVMAGHQTGFRAEHFHCRILYVRFFAENQILWIRHYKPNYCSEYD